jgi:hypothetical protein
MVAAPLHPSAVMQTRSCGWTRGQQMRQRLHKQASKAPSGSKALSGSVLVCIALASGAIFAMAAQATLLHLGLDVGRIRDGFVAAPAAHSRSALAWWAWWSMPLAAFGVGPLSVALARWVAANWWLFRGARLVLSAALILALGVIGELPPAAATLDVRAGAAVALLVASLSALLAWLGHVVLGARRPLARPVRPVAARVAPVLAAVPWRGGGSAGAGAPFRRTRFPLARLAGAAVLGLAVFAAVGAVGGVNVLVDQSMPPSMRERVVREAPPRAPAAAVASRDGIAGPAASMAAAAVTAGRVVDALVIPESELTFAKGYKRRAALAAAERRSVRIVAAAERAERKMPARLRRVAALRPVEDVRPRAAAPRATARHQRAHRRDATAPRHAPPPAPRANARRHARGHDRVARVEPGHRASWF